MNNMNQYKLGKLYNIIYYEWYLDIRAGGPTGYLANLLDGINQIKNPDLFLTLFCNMKKTKVNQEIKPTSNEDRRRMHNDYVNFLNNFREVYCNEELFKKIDISQTRSIHTHTIRDALRVNNTLREKNIDHIKTILTCHTPEATSNEFYNSYIESGYSKEEAEEIRNGWKVIEKKVFENTDILIFPSKEAMEPLLDTMNGFEQIAKEKDIRFVATGAKKLNPTLTKEEAKKKYHVEGKFVVGYIGRHNEVKGYDNLKEAAKKVLDKHKDIVFLIGGAQGNVFEPLNDKNWIEAGWVNPEELFMAIDVFVLPNRRTYFDLVLLEVMSMGIPIIASNTGGNKSVKSVATNIELYDNSIKGLVSKIDEMYNYNETMRQLKGENISKAYTNYFTTAKFAERYQDTIEQIYRDYNIV